jgi:hypothetical protein
MCLPLDSRFEQGVVAMLAVRICEEYGKTPGSILMRDAADGWNKLQAAFIATPEALFDVALVATTRRPVSTLTSNYQDWTGDTVYDIRTFAINNFNLYECITGGTSASSGGPTGTDASITDGTVVWCWRRVTA